MFFPSLLVPLSNLLFYSSSNLLRLYFSFCLVSGNKSLFERIKKRGREREGERKREREREREYVLDVVFASCWDGCCNMNRSISTQRQLYVFMALLRVSRLRVSANPQVLKVSHLRQGHFSFPMNTQIFFFQSLGWFRVRPKHQK